MSYIKYKMFSRLYNYYYHPPGPAYLSRWAFKSKMKLKDSHESIISGDILQEFATSLAQDHGKYIPHSHMPNKI